MLDFFAGSGTLGSVAAALRRRFVLCDDNPQAIEVISRRLQVDDSLFDTNVVEFIHIAVCPTHEVDHQSGGSNPRRAGAITSGRTTSARRRTRLWQGSPFYWIKSRASRQIGAIGEALVAGWAASKGFDVTKQTALITTAILNRYTLKSSFRRSGPTTRSSNSNGSAIRTSITAFASESRPSMHKLGSFRSPNCSRTALPLSFLSTAELRVATPSGCLSKHRIRLSGWTHSVDAWMRLRR